MPVASVLIVSRLITDPGRRSSCTARRSEIVVVPGIIAMRIPVVIERILIDDDFDRRVADRPAKVVISLDVDFHFLAQPESFLLAVLFGSLHRNFELRQFVLFQPKQFCAADTIACGPCPKTDVVFAQRQLLAEFERTPGAAETIQRRFAFGYFRVRADR